MRLQKFFSECGILSRRAAEEAIRQGLIKVNGVTAEIGADIDPKHDTVEYRGRRIRPRNPSDAKLYILLHKPAGYVTTTQDEKGRPTVIQLTRGVGRRIYPVGRLDFNSEGLLLLTDDGDLTLRLTHPRHRIPKIYEVTVTTTPTAEQLAALRAPMELDGYRLLPVEVALLSDTVLKMTLYEGRNRQIRRMCEAVGLRIRRLSRTAIGSITLGDLPRGKWRHLTPEEVAYLQTESQKED